MESTDGLSVLATIELVAILVHYQPSYNTSHTIKPSDPLLLPDVDLQVIKLDQTSISMAIQRGNTACFMECQLTSGA